MFASSLVLYLVCICATFAASSIPHQLDREKRDSMKEIKAFVVSLDLPLSQAQDLTSKLESDPNLAAFLKGKDYDASGLISLACQSAQTCFWR